MLLSSAGKPQGEIVHAAVDRQCVPLSENFHGREAGCGDKYRCSGDDSLMSVMQGIWEEAGVYRIFCQCQDTQSDGETDVSICASLLYSVAGDAGILSQGCVQGWCLLKR